MFIGDLPLSCRAGAKPSPPTTGYVLYVCYVCYVASPVAASTAGRRNV